MNDSTYFLLVRILNQVIWRGTLIGAENLPKEGPAVFVANHLGPKGPIGTVCSIHLRVYPWIIANMVDQRLAADYLKIDFVEPSLGLKPPLSVVIAKAISLVSTSLLSSIDCVPVYKGEYEGLQLTLQESLSLLRNGKILLVFPEEPDMEMDPKTNMEPFMKSFTRLGELYFEETGKILSFYPIAVHESKKVIVGQPIPFNPDLPHGLERHQLKDLLEDRIKEMYLELA